MKKNEIYPVIPKIGNLTIEEHKELCSQLVNHGEKDNTNTIEQAAEKYCIEELGNRNNYKTKQTLEFYDTQCKTTKSDFIAGAKSNAAKEYWQQNMSSYDDISHAIAYTYNMCKQGLTHEQILKEYNKVHRKPYNSEAKEYHTKGMYSEEEVLELLEQLYQYVDINVDATIIKSWFETDKKK